MNNLADRDFENGLAATEAIKKHFGDGGWWYRIEDRVPDSCVPVLTKNNEFRGKCKYRVAHHTPQGWYDCHSNDRVFAVTHWRPIL